MGFTAKELLRSRKQSDTTAELRYVATWNGEDGDELNEANAKEAMRVQLWSDLGYEGGTEPLSYRQLWYADCKMDEYAGGGLYFFTIEFGTRQLSFATQGTDFEFDTTGGTMTICSAYSHIADFPATKPGGGHEVVKNYNGLINVTVDNQVNGIEVPMPRFAFTKSWTMPVSILTGAYVSNLYYYTGFINSAEWSVQIVPAGEYITFLPREVMFMGARGRQHSGELATLQYSFVASRSLNNEPWSGVEGITKAGMDYMWPQYGPSIESARAGEPLMKLRGFSVERIAREVNFSVLGIP